LGADRLKIRGLLCSLCHDLRHGIPRKAPPMHTSWPLHAFKSLALFAGLLGAVLGSARASPAVLSLDFDELDVTGTPTLTAVGFQSFTIDEANAVVTTSVVRTFGPLTVTLAPNNASFGFDDRQRATPVDSGSFTGGNLLRDFVFSRATGAGVIEGIDVTIAGLTANTPYQFTIWSFDSGSLGNRVSDWFANGTEVVSDYAFNGSVLPTDDSQYHFMFTASTNGAGQMVIGGRRDPASIDGAGAASFGVFLNALQIDTVVPEPTSAILLIGALGICSGRRRNGQRPIYLA